jgi:hypothetical protein
VDRRTVKGGEVKARNGQGPTPRGAAVAFAQLLLIAAPIRAQVHLELRTDLPEPSVGDIVRFDLVALADADPVSFNGLDAVVVWDATVLRLVSDTEEYSGFAWTRAGFPNDSNLDRINADCGPDQFCSPYTFRPYNDGDGLFQAVSLFANPPPSADSAGLIVTTLSFQALASAGVTSVRFAPTYGVYSQSRVVASGKNGTQAITGELRGTFVSVGHCGGPHDFDWNCVVGPADAADSLACMSGPDSPVLPDCTRADADGDADVDLHDVKRLQIAFGEP